MPPAVKLQDVASLAGVHIATASRALDARAAGVVAPQTAARVRQAAEQLGYRANRIAQGLKTQRSFFIGMLIPDITNPLFPPIVHGVEDTLAAAGYSLLLANANDRRKVRRQVTTMLERRVDGLLLATARRRDADIQQLRCGPVPMVLVNRTVSRGRVSAVIPDDRQGLTLAVEHLLRLGHRRIAYVGSRLDMSSAARRGVMFDHIARALGLSETVTVEEAAFDATTGYRAAMKLLGAPQRPTAVVAGNNLMALGVLDAAAGHGLQCPRDLSIVGCNDILLANRFEPALTTVRVAKHQLGSRAAELLLALIDDPGRCPETVVVAPDLIVRSSTGPVADCG